MKKVVIDLIDRHINTWYDTYKRSLEDGDYEDEVSGCDDDADDDDDDSDGNSVSWFDMCFDKC